MDCLSILQRYHSKILSKRWNKYPVADSAIGLHLTLNRMQDDLDTPLSLNVRPLTKNLLFKIMGGLHSHAACGHLCCGSECVGFQHHIEHYIRVEERSDHEYFCSRKLV